MKHKTYHSIILLLGCVLLASCGSNGSSSTKNVSISANSVSIASDTVQGDFSLSTEDGSVSTSDNVYTISAAGTYTATGKLADGMIYVAAGEEDEVEIVFNGASITNSTNSAIFVESAGEVKIKAKNGTSNFVTDSRSEQTTEDDSQGPAAIYAKADLKLAGQGALTVVGGYNNGVHTSDDLEIKNLTLTVTAPNNALKGNDSLSIYSGTVNAISTSGDALKTTNSDISSTTSKQRGNIEISGGTLNLYAGGDGIDAAYNVLVYNGVSEDDPTLTLVPQITIRTNKYSSYSSSSVLNSVVTDLMTVENVYPGPGGGWGPGGGAVPGEDTKTADKADGSAKGIKAANAIYVQGGVTDIAAYDDGIHANSGDALENGSKGVGLIEFDGGTTNIVASDDGVHADGTINVKSGSVYVNESHEGIEGNIINILGGRAVAYGTDDGVNSSKQLNVSGGYLFAAVPSSGDTDAIDSNGSISITGGTVIAAGPNNQNAGAVDADGTVTVSGGTLVAFGYAAPRNTSLTQSSKSGTYGGKAYTLTFTNGKIETENLSWSGYSNCTCYSELGSITSIS
ncbi:MAG: carbohydrate-binding domain-containing protein [Bacilli bacterium]|nr:carbohydrate-binding domain-containing protein [Bacilli bacterium]